MEQRAGLEDLEGRSADVKQSSMEFDAGSNKLKNRYQWERKMIKLAAAACCGLTLLIVLYVLH